MDIELVGGFPLPCAFLEVRVVSEKQQLSVTLLKTLSKLSYSFFFHTKAQNLSKYLIEKL